MGGKDEAKFSCHVGQVIDKKTDIGGFPEVPYRGAEANQVILVKVTWIDLLNSSEFTITRLLRNPIPDLSGDFLGVAGLRVVNK